MSNLYLASSFVFLANQQAGCLDENNDTVLNCSRRVYGMAPSAIVSNVAVVSGILSAFLTPCLVLFLTIQVPQVGGCAGCEDDCCYTGNPNSYH